MREEIIRVVIVRPDVPAVEAKIKNDLKSLQEVVSEGAPYRGFIECLGIDPGVDLICNEEGKLIKLKPCRRVVFDVICGTFIITGADDSRGELISLTDEQVKKYMDMFKEPEEISENEVDGSISIRFMPF